MWCMVESVLEAFIAEDVVEHQRGNGAGLEGAKGVAKVLHRWMSGISLTVEDLVVAGELVWTRNRARGVNTGWVMGFARRTGQLRSMCSTWDGSRAARWSSTGEWLTNWVCSCRWGSIPGPCPPTIKLARY